MKARTYIIVTLCMIGISNLLPAQDIHFSQFGSTPSLVNPALTGDFLGNQRGGIAYRDQWRSISKPFTTAHAFYDCSINEAQWKDQYVGLGLDLFSDRAGDGKMGTTSFSLNSSYAKALSLSSIYSFGVQLSFVQRSVDFTQFTWDSQFNGLEYDPALSSQEPMYNENFIKPDLSAGMSWNCNIDKYSASRVGFAMFHINSPNLKYYNTGNERVAPRYVLHAEARIEQRSAIFAFLPKILYQRQNTLNELLFGGMMEWEIREGSRITGWITESSVAFGLYHRWGDAIVLTSQLYLENFDIGLSYDFNVSNLTRVSKARGGFEISILYTSPFVSRWRKGASRSSY
ncbi:MAG: PorP/SprF family type IX secretion system membrane protein [Bacteroidetes bacterium]|nr:PorP/SprF family type IX secretion system membrane protein [Bacteroidota bacterium]MBU1720834.1 PorP/SprF family type IX secretion system membrane protein [Bacteroidota bacterium]